VKSLITNTDGTPTRARVVLLSSRDKRTPVRSTALMERFSDVSIPITPETFDTFIPPHLVTEDNLQMMLSMGFTETRAKKALVLAGGALEDAVEWLSQHQEDADIDNDLSFAQYVSIKGIQPKQLLPAPLVSAIDNSICTFAASGKSYCPQVWFKCVTCNLVNNEGCCLSCARLCHAGHELTPGVFSQRFFCDCGAYRPNCVALGVFK